MSEDAADLGQKPLVTMRSSLSHKKKKNTPPDQRFLCKRQWLAATARAGPRIGVHIRRGLHGGSCIPLQILIFTQTCLI